MKKNKYAKKILSSGSKESAGGSVSINCRAFSGVVQEVWNSSIMSKFNYQKLYILVSLINISYSNGCLNLSSADVLISTYTSSCGKQPHKQSFSLMVNSWIQGFIGSRGDKS